MVPPAAMYGILNIASATGIVFANKAVFAWHAFSFPYALTFVHTLVTYVGMQMFLRWGVFEGRKDILSKGEGVKTKLFSLAAAYVGYIVLCNLNLNINPVGFYQISKIAVAPAVLTIDWLMYGKRSSREVMGSIGVVCLGVGMATVSDPEMSGDVFGLLVGLGSVLATALYQIWAGSIQKDLGLGSMQLLHLYIPLAAMQLGVVALFFEPLGVFAPTAKTIMGYPYSPSSVAAILISAVLGLLVNLSTFLVIGATSSLTYNVVGHIKTVIILTGGVVFFGDSMSGKKFLGILFAMGGIVWYSMIKLRESRNSSKAKALKELEQAENGLGVDKE